MGEHSEWHGHRLKVLPEGDSWLAAPARPSQPPPEAEAGQVAETAGVAEATHVPGQANKSWLSVVILAVLGIAALITIFVANGSGRVAEPAPLPSAPSQLITSLDRAHTPSIQVRVGEYIVLALPSGRTYSTVVEQSSITTPVIEDLKLPGQQPQLRADSPGHSTVEVMSQPTCANPDSCPDQRTLLGTLDVTVTS